MRRPGGGARGHPHGPAHQEPGPGAAQCLGPGRSRSLGRQRRRHRHQAAMPIAPRALQGIRSGPVSGLVRRGRCSGAYGLLWTAGADSPGHARRGRVPDPAASPPARPPPDSTVCSQAGPSSFCPLLRSAFLGAMRHVWLLRCRIPSIGDHHPVETRQHPGNIALMTFNEGVRRRTSSAWGLPTTIDPGTCLVPAMPG